MCFLLIQCFHPEEEVPWNDAWQIITKTFAYTNHTVLPEALEKWPVHIFEQLLPRHLQIIYDLNWTFLQSVARKFPGDVDKISRMSLIDEGNGRQVRMANLAVSAFIIHVHFMKGL